LHRAEASLDVSQALPPGELGKDGSSDEHSFCMVR
jgi:hypothetical protein